MKITNKAYQAVLLASAAIWSIHAVAQETAASTPSPEEVIVTGTRITAKGYEAPTPVTILKVEELQTAAPASLTDGLNQLPQFLGSDGYRQTNFRDTDTTSKGNYLNLRNLGSNRLLIMMDGVRVPPSNYTGTTNVDVIPQLLINRVDVVTAGASAAYGSDAVAGAVNYVLDRKFTGFKSTLQGGISGEGDNGNYRVGLAGGYQVSERLHLLASYERFNSNGILRQRRPLGGDKYVDYGLVGKTGDGPPGTAANPLISVRDVGQAFAPDGGLFLDGFLADGTPLDLGFGLPGFVPGASFMTINPNGSLRFLDFGELTGTPGFAVGGDNRPVVDFADVNTPLTTDNAFLRADYDFSDNLSGYVQGTYSKSRLSIFGSGSAIVGLPVFSGNAFLPQQVQDAMSFFDVDHIAYYSSIGTALPSRQSFTDSRTEYYSVQTGLTTSFGDGWTAGVHYSYGRSKDDVLVHDILEMKPFLASMDAVDDGSGNIVCRVTLTNPNVFPGCRPWNVFGAAAQTSDPLAIDQNFNDVGVNSTLTHHEVVADVGGEPFSLWAGPVAMAGGLLYRVQRLDSGGTADPSVPIDYTGIRGADASTQPFFFGSTAGAEGEVKVKEAFGEVAVPLLKDVAFAQLLDVNGAVRVTDYSTSGTVTTWKVGGTYQPIEDIRFRITRSRDIRAPTLYNLFAGLTLGTTQFDDCAHTNPPGSGPCTNQVKFVTTRGSGNIDLVPEVAKTLTFGVILQPRFLPRFNLSVDWYNTEIDNAIGASPNPTALSHDCEVAGGVGPACDAIVRPSPFTDRTAGNYPLFVLTQPLNLSSLEVEGIDIEASYATPLRAGNLNIQLYGSRISKFSAQASPTAPVFDYAGFGGELIGTDTANIPKFRGTLALTYSINNFSVYAQERYIGKLKRGPEFVYEAKDFPRVLYTDITLSYLLKVMGGDANLFLTVNNLFNRKPPLGAVDESLPASEYPTLSDLYDQNWRAYTAGVRLKF